MRAVLKVLGVLVLVLVLIAVLLGVWLAWTIRRSWPVTSGTVDVPGVSAPVDVVRDDRGIPQIYADTLEDLFFAQGYVHAQDRFYEMDVRRHITAGRLSEMFGKSQVKTDAFIRTLGWRRVAEQEYGLLNPTSKRILDAYAKGVNAYLADRSGAALSLEYQILALQNPSYSVEPWGPVDSLAWLKALSWDLHGNEDDESTRALTANVVGVPRTEELYPPYPYDTHQPIVLTGAVVDGVFDASVARPTATAGAAAAVLPRASMPVLAKVHRLMTSLDGVLGPLGDGIGSNSWVVGGGLTQSGKPLLANDPHLAPAMPSLWYQAGLHCRTVSPDCAYDVAGWTMSGMPGVFIGHNARVAWGFTNLGPDVSDLVLEKVDGDSYEYDGAKVPLKTRQEVIKVAGGDPVTITVRETRHGPLVSDVAESGETYVKVGQQAPVPAPGQQADTAAVPPRGTGYAVAMEWTALTPRATFDAFDALATASDWKDFRYALSLMSDPSQNVIYADVDGNIGYQAPGIVPIRKGYNGKWPVPGWTSEYAWTGTIPYDALPNVLNPEQGFITTANQAVTYPGYKYFLTDDWAYGARSQRITDRIEAATTTGKMTTAEMQSIQMDAYNELAAFLAPRLRPMPAGDQARQALALFDGWDFQQQQDSAAGAYFNAFYKQLVTRMFDATLSSAGVQTNRSDQYWQVIKDLWDHPDNAWWDDGTQPGTQTRDQTVVASLDAAAAELVQSQGSDPTSWQWGRMHQLSLENQSLGQSGIAPIEWLFNRGPAPVGGGGSIVQATGWTPADGYGVNWVPSMRQVVDLSDLDASTWVNLTGQSGHAFNPLYNDQFESWRTGQQYPWAFTRAAVDAAGAEVLTLRPPSG